MTRESRLCLVGMGDMINIIGIYRRPVELGVLARGIEDRMNRPVQFFNMRKFGIQATTDIGNSQERNKNLLTVFSTRLPILRQGGAIFTCNPVRL